MDNVGSVALWGTIFTGVGTIIGILLNQGTNAYLKFKADTRVGKQEQDGILVKGYEYVIAQLNAQNEKLEKERKEQIVQLTNALNSVQGKHFECEKIQEGLRIQNLAQQQDISQLQIEVEKLNKQVEKLESK